jgi:hypothetical protein
MTAVTEGKSCVQFPQPSETLSYQPFYGKFATTGQAQGPAEFQPESERPAKKSPSHRGGGGPRNGGGGPAAPGTGATPLQAPSPPPASPPGGGRTGGAPPG